MRPVGGHIGIRTAHRLLLVVALLGITGDADAPWWASRGVLYSGRGRVVSGTRMQFLVLDHCDLGGVLNPGNWDGENGSEAGGDDIDARLVGGGQHGSVAETLHEEDYSIRVGINHRARDRRAMPVLRIIQNRYVGVVVRSRTDDSCAAEPDHILRGNVVPADLLVRLVAFLPSSGERDVADLVHPEPVQKPLRV